MSIFFLTIGIMLLIPCFWGWWVDDFSGSHRQEVYAWIGIFIALAFYFRG